MNKNVALVTGGAIRVGRAICRELAEQGYRLIVHYHSSSEPAESLSRELQTMGAEHCLVTADLSDRGGIECLLEQIPPAFKDINLLVNSAAIFPDDDHIGQLSEHWDSVMNLNARAPILLAEAVFKRCASLQQVINIVDARVYRNQTQRLSYRWSKLVLAQATKDLALVMAPKVRVNAVALGAILPPPGADETYLSRLEKSIPLQQTGDTDAVARAVRYLVQQPFVTGQVLSLDGGEFL
ncbi:SDR family oxidoreductase [Pleionea litopenaei]|uniref:SDR family oxidoreductase n=1 Tax=Pleionea litopenaei TaxID=3070815 RepID=A0AA51RQB2_9GAMM|nr:SDR family oxidoreductase [Pleionea sp. HL-JVS1]WMS85577.1 SDR family oxidoreductase [Pleionea sp. HL-JVS1]